MVDVRFESETHHLDPCGFLSTTGNHETSHMDRIFQETQNEILISGHISETTKKRILNTYNHNRERQSKQLEVLQQLAQRLIGDVQPTEPATAEPSPAQPWPAGGAGQHHERGCHGTWNHPLLPPTTPGGDLHRLERSANTDRRIYDRFVGGNRNTDISVMNGNYLDGEYLSIYDIGWTEGQVTGFSQWDEKRIMVRATVYIPEKGKRKAIPIRPPPPSLLERRGWP